MSADTHASGHERDADPMALLGDRRFAAAVLAVIVLVFTPLGAKLSLQRAVKEVEKQFFTGVEGRGAIAEYLNSAGNAATGLISVGLNYKDAREETGELRVDKSLFNDVKEGKDISEYASANALLVKSFNALREKLLTLELEPEDAESLEYYASQFDGAQGAIPHAGYNEAAEAFIRDTYDRFPTGLLGSLLGVEPPEIFQ